MYPDDFLQKKLAERKKNGSLRELRVAGGKTDLCSNDYLGIVKNAQLQTSNAKLHSGSTGSRLLSGNYALIEQVENEIAHFHQAAAGLIFNSGYDANIGLLSSVPQKGDTILYDHLCHASIRDGIRLSFAAAFSFPHNDMTELEKKIKLATGKIFIVTESVFSMDGDLCPLEELVAIAKQHRAHLVIDEAHATGVVGEKGEGLVQHLQLQDNVFARVHTFGKACGCHGAIILGSASLRQYLINFARSFVFSTALPEHDIAVIKESYQVFPSMISERAHLQELIVQFQSAGLRYEKLISSTPIQVVVIPGNEAVKEAANLLQQNGLDVRPILYPTVPIGKERLRIVLHAFNTREEIVKLTGLLGGPLKKIIPAFLFLCLSIGGHAQISSYNITVPDSMETVYTKLQREIKSRETGVFSNTAFDSAAKMTIITKYTNFIGKGQFGNVWTIIQREKYDEKKRLQQEEFWKTDNDGAICRCGNWQLKSKGIWVTKTAYPSCTDKKFNCDAEGKEIKR